MDVAAVQSWQKQPEHKAVVWQHNRLSEARYELTAREQKLLLLVIANHFDGQTQTHLDLVTSWFDTAYVGRNGAGYFAVTISQVLKPYLLQVKREFFRFQIGR